MHRFSFDRDTNIDANDALDWLHNNGWILGHTSEDGDWLIMGKKGAKIIRASGGTLEDACINAVEQARLAIEMN